MMIKSFVRFASVLFLVSAAAPAFAHGEKDEPPREKANFPDTDIFLLDLSLGDSPAISNARNVTGLAAYENQPSFTPDSSSFLFSRSDEYQTDVYEYLIASKTTRRITRTATNEFSPVASPDNKTISFVTDGPGANQNIAKVTRARPELEKKLLPGSSMREPTGYYSWDHVSGNVLFWSRYGFNVTLTHADKEEAHYVSGNAVPSTPYVIPGTSNFSFVHRQGNGSVWIKELNPVTKAVRPLTPVVGANANYGWAPDGSIMMIEAGTLYRWMEGTDGGWKVVADLADHGIKEAARLAVSPDGTKLAIVGQPASD
ncbi:MAG: hypothetical protein ACSHXY_02570 [Alphaproteobacteria bacterium]